jgi:hypothetical protein
MKEGSFEYKLFQKIKNREELNFNEIQWIERLLTLSEVNEEILNEQIGLKKSKKVEK